MNTIAQEDFYAMLRDKLKLVEEEFPDICCKECNQSSWNDQKHLFHCDFHGIFVKGADTCDEAEK